MRRMRMNVRALCDATGSRQRGKSAANPAAIGDWRSPDGLPRGPVYNSKRLIFKPKLDERRRNSREIPAVFRFQGHTRVASSSLVPGNDRRCFSPTRAWCSSRTCSSAATCAPTGAPPVRQRRARRRQAQRSRERGLPRGTTRSSRCWATSASATISSATRSSSRGTLTGVYGLPKERLWVTVYHEDDEAYGIWADEVGVPKGSASCASATTRAPSTPPTTSGRWPTPAPAADGTESSTTTARAFRAAARLAGGRR